MAETHFNNSNALTDVYYNGTQLDKVYFNDTLVFERIKLQTDTIKFKYEANGGSGGVYFHFYKSINYTLSQKPKKVVSITGGLGGEKTTWVILGDLNGRVTMPSDDKTASGSGSNYITLNWSISNNIINFTSDDNYSGVNEIEVKITYQY